MTAVLVETEDLVFAARTLRSGVVGPLGIEGSRLFRTLDGCAAMAGSDPGGTAWAAAYDAAAAVAVQATQDAVNAADGLAALFAQTARNYAAADEASTAAGRRAVAAAVAVLPCMPPYVLPGCVPASAAGGSSRSPAGWWLVAHVVGYVWPNGHQDRLLRAADAWSACAVQLASRSTAVLDACRAAQADRLPESADMWTACVALEHQLSALASVHRELAAACRGLAAHLDAAHHAVTSELVSLLEWTAAIEVGGGLLSLATFGIAEVPTQAVEGHRVAAAAARISRLIATFVDVARGLAVQVTPLGAQASEVAAGLRPLLAARPIEAAITPVGVLRAIRADRELRAIEELSREGAAGVTIYADKAAARAALSGDLRVAANRFFRDATSKCRDFRITQLSDGRYRMEFFAPANNPGYGKFYVQIIDSSGRRVAEYKDTFGPTGLIERKWLEGGPS